MIVRDDLRLELYRVENAAPISIERNEAQTSLRFEGLNHFGIAAGALGDKVAELEADGIVIVIPPSLVPNGSGDRFAFIRSNEGMFIELFQA